MTELDSKIAGLVDEIRAIENGQHDPEASHGLLDHLVWIRLSLLAHRLAKVKDQHGSAALHARAAAASLREHHVALLDIDEDERRHHAALENVTAQIDAADRQAVSTEKSAISAEFLGAGIVDRLSRAGIPDRFLRSNGRHRPEDIVIDLLIAEAAILFESHKGKRAPLPTLSAETGRYHGEFFDFVMITLPADATNYGIQLDDDGAASAIASRIKRVIPFLRKLELTPIG
jgi:hypothetical protein